MSKVNEEVRKLVNINRTKLTPQEEFKSLLTSQDKTAWAIKEAVESCGFRLGLSSKGGRDTKSTKTVICLTTLVRLAHDKGSGVESVKFALRTAEKCWPDDTMGINNNMVSGLAMFWKRHEGIVDEERLVGRLRNTTPHKIMYTANQTATYSGSKASAVADVIEKMYTKRMKKKAE